MGEGGQNSSSETRAEGPLFFRTAYVVAFLEYTGNAVRVA